MNGATRLRLLLAAGLLVGLAACASAPEPSPAQPATGGPTAAAPAETAEPDTTQPDMAESGSEEPAAPPPDYDLARAEAATARADAALVAGDAAAAAAAYAEALQHWPTHPPAWSGLAAAYRAQGAKNDAERAEFFAARAEWLERIHPLAARAALRNLRDDPETSKQAADPAYRAEAARIMAFLEARDVGNVIARQEASPRETWLQRNAAYTFLVVGGVALVVVVASGGI